MAYEEFEFDSYASDIGNKLDSMQIEVESKIDDLLSEVKGKGPYYTSRSYYYNDIADITFTDIEKAKDLLEDISFIPIETRDLLPEEVQKYVTHTYVSTRLDSIEENLLSVVSAGGSENIKALSAALLDQDTLTSLMDGAYTFDGDIRNRKQRLLAIYTSQNSTGNISWMNDIYNFNLEDKERNMYQTMFDLAQESYNWAIDNIVKAEAVHAAFTSQYNTVISNVIDANIAAYKADVMANIAQLDFDLTELDAKLDVKEMEVDSRVKESTLTVEQYSSRLAAYATRYSKNVSENMQILDHRMSGVKAAADTYEKIIVGYAQRFGAVSIGRQ